MWEVGVVWGSQEDQANLRSGDEVGREGSSLLWLFPLISPVNKWSICPFPLLSCLLPFLTYHPLSILYAGHSGNTGRRCRCRAPHSPVSFPETPLIQEGASGFSDLDMSSGFLDRVTFGVCCPMSMSPFWKPCAFFLVCVTLQKETLWKGFGLWFGGRKSQKPLWGSRDMSQGKGGRQCRLHR